MSPLAFVSDVRAELARVVWPSRQQVTRLTGQVILISVIVGVFLGILDYLLTSATQYLIK